MKKVLMLMLVVVLAACQVPAVAAPEDVPVVATTAPAVIASDEPVTQITLPVVVTEAPVVVTDAPVAEAPVGTDPVPVNLKYELPGHFSIDVNVMMRALDEFPKDSKPALNKFYYAPGHDQLAYMWVPKGESGSTFASPEEDRCNFDPANFPKFYEVVLPEDDEWAPEDIISLSLAMDTWAGVKNTGMCVMSAYMDLAPPPPQ